MSFTGDSRKGDSMEPTNAEVATAAGKAIFTLLAMGFWLYAISAWLWAAVLTIIILVGVLFIYLWGMFLGL